MFCNYFTFALTKINQVKLRKFGGLIIWILLQLLVKLFNHLLLVNLFLICKSIFKLCDNIVIVFDVQKQHVHKFYGVSGRDTVLFVCYLEDKFNEAHLVEIEDVSGVQCATAVLVLKLIDLLDHRFIVVSVFVLGQL